MGSTSNMPWWRQPPLYLIAAVVLASLLPLMVGGPSTGSRTVSGQSLHRVTHLRPAPWKAVLGIGIDPVQRLDAATLQPAQLDRRSADEEIVIVVEESTDEQTPTVRGSGVELPRTAVGLLAAAKKAYASGRPGTALQLARRSRRLSPSSEALAVEAKAACKMKRQDAARDAYREVRFGDQHRRQIRKACRQSGVWVL